MLIAVKAAGISHADVMQRQGNYPPPPAHRRFSVWRVAGTVAAAATGVTRWKAGDRVCALTNGGGYAEYVAVPAGQVLPIPEGWSAIEAATLPENAFTVYDNLFTRARLRAGETVWFTAERAASASTAIMFATALGCDRHRNRRQRGKVRRLSSDSVPRAGDRLSNARFRRRGSSVSPKVAASTSCSTSSAAITSRVTWSASRSTDASHASRRSAAAPSNSTSARSLQSAAPSSARACARAPPHRKPRSRGALRDRIWPLLPQRDTIVPVVDSVYPFERAAEAHARMESSAHVGKIVLVRLSSDRCARLIDVRSGGHEEEHRNREHRVDARSQERDAARFDLLFVGGRNEAEDLLLIQPDEPQTLISMIVPSHAPMPIGAMAPCKQEGREETVHAVAAVKLPSSAAPKIHVTTAPQRKKSSARGMTYFEIGAASPAAVASLTAATLTKLKK